jgi:tripartite-type tricarboxylate transporter receptor subunit TctC
MSLIAAFAASSMRPVLKAVCAVAICLALGNPTVRFAQSYPVKPIRIVVTSYGSGPDIMARLIGQRLTEAWGQQVVVDARVGASGRIVGERVAKSAPDGTH